MKRFIEAFPGMKHSVIYTDVDGRHFRFSGGTWAWRNHNPGNLYAGHVSQGHNQIGVTYDFAIFPDDQSGHDALLDSLHTTYGNSSIHDMIYSFAPPKDNPTARYEKLLHEAAGVYDDTPINNFTSLQFEHLWQGIQKFEGYKVGDIIEVFRITGVKAIDKHTYQFCLNGGDWVSELECIVLAKSRSVELEVCISHYGNTYLRSYPKSTFQAALNTLIKK